MSRYHAVLQTDVSDEWTATDIQLDNSWTAGDDQLKTNVIKSTTVRHVNVSQAQLMTITDSRHVSL